MSASLDPWGTIVKYIASLGKPVPPAVWKAIESNKASLTPELVKGILWGHGIKAPPVVRAAFVEISRGQVLQAPATNSDAPPESDADPVLFRINHVYSRSITSQIVSDTSSEYLGSSDTEPDLCVETEYFLVTNLLDARGEAAEVVWLYSKAQILSDLPDKVLRNIHFPLSPAHFALSNHRQTLVAADLDDLTDVSSRVVWGHTRLAPASSHTIVVTHYVQVEPNLAPIVPVEQCAVFANRAKIESASDMIAKLLMATAQNEVRPVTAFHKATTAATFDPVLQRQSYLPCIFLEPNKARNHHPKSRYKLQWGGSASPWAVAIIKLYRYGQHNVPWVSDEACGEFEAWCEALMVAKKRNEVKMGSTTLALDKHEFGPSLFTHFSFF